MGVRVSVCCKRVSLASAPGDRYRYWYPGTRYAGTGSPASIGSRLWKYRNLYPCSTKTSTSMQNRPLSVSVVVDLCAVPGTRGDRVPGIQIRVHLSIPLQVVGICNTRVPGVPGYGYVPRYANPAYPCTRVPGYPGTRVPGYRAVCCSYSCTSTA
eukprot:3600826-Rhodomonas_salina.1